MLQMGLLPLLSNSAVRKMEEQRYRCDVGVATTVTMSVAAGASF
jgi:hypothetical protein